MVLKILVFFLTLAWLYFPIIDLLTIAKLMMKITSDSNIKNKLLSPSLENNKLDLKIPRRQLKDINILLRYFEFQGKNALCLEL